MIITRQEIDATHAELGRRIDELELNLFKVTTAGMNHETLADGNDTLLCARNGSLEHEEVVLDDTVMRESTHGRDGFLGRIGFGRCVVLVSARSDTVNLFVEFCPVVITIW